MAKKIKAVPLNINKGTCTAQSSNCITWEGPDIPCLNLCKGATVTEVVYNLGIEFCNLYADLSPDNYNLECLDLDNDCDITFQDLFQALIDKVCNIQITSESCNLYAKITPQEGPYSVTVENGTEPYTYEWSIADNYGLFQITSNPTAATATVTRTASVPADELAFTACGTNNAARMGMLRVKVTDSKGCIATDTFLIIEILCG